MTGWNIREVDPRIMLTVVQRLMPLGIDASYF
jgi:hypothetical protein